MTIVDLTRTATPWVADVSHADWRPMGSRSQGRCDRWLRMMIASLVAVAGLAAAELTVSGTVPWCDGNGWTPVLTEVSAPLGGEAAVVMTVGQSAASWPVRLDAGGREQRWVLIPSSGTRWGNQVQATWPRADGSENRTSINPLLDSDHALALVRPAGGSGITGGGVLSGLELMRNGRTRSSSTGSAPFRPSELDPAHLPDQWQAYPSWLTLVFLPGSESALSGAQRQALLHWIGQGGTVVMDPAWHAAWTTNGHKPLALPMSGALAAAATDARWNGLIATLTGRQRLLRAGFETDAPDDRVPGTDSDGSGLALVAVLMTLALATVPLLWARKRRQPLFLLVAIPVTSGAVCLALLGWDVARYGLSATRTALHLTLIDPQTAEHTTWSTQTRFGAWGVGVLPLAAGERWLFADHTDEWRISSGVQRTNDLARRELTGDLIRGRENAHLACTTVTPDRRRVAMRREGDHWVLVNGLGVGIRALTWITPDGQHLHAAGIPPDGTAPLVAAGAGVALADAARLPALAHVTWERLADLPGAWRAELAAPLSPLPGLNATDAIPPRGFACGLQDGVTP